MPHVYKAESLGKIHKNIIMDLLECPEHVPSPRGQKCNEVLGATIVLKNPRARIINSPARAVNYGFAVGELCWYLNGSSDLETMLYYNKRMSAFSDDGKTLRSAYGARIFNARFGPDGQFDLAARELIADPDSRRAILHINEPNDLYVATSIGTKDVPCTLALQFFIREKRLYLHVTMRSNDVIWGMPYDIFSFTIIQEAMLGTLRALGMDDLELGEYYHTIGSIHLYERHIEMAKKISEEKIIAAKPMATLDITALKTLLVMEDDIRAGIYDADRFPGEKKEPLRWFVDQLIRHHQKRLKEVAKQEES